MRKLFTALIVALTLACGLRADTPFITAVSLQSTANNVDGDLGNKEFNFTTGNLTITQLGRWMNAGNTQDHTLKIWSDDATPVLLGSVVVNMTGTTASTFKYGSITPVVIPPGDGFYITSSETSGGDTWRTFGATMTTTGAAGMTAARIVSGVPTVVGGTNWSYGPVNYQYEDIATGWTKTDPPGPYTYTTDGSQYGLLGAMADSTAEDTIIIPNGTYTYGSMGSFLRVDKAVTIQGESRSGTVINMATDGRAYGGFFVVTAAATLKTMTANGNSTTTTGFVTPGTVNGWRVTDVTWGGSSGGYFVGPCTTYGVIDNCTIGSSNAQSELIFARGPSNAWTSGTTMGTTNAVYLENNKFITGGYVCDFNSNGKGVVRFNTIAANQKVDGHGVASNDPAQSFRSIETYNNRWTSASSITAIEYRGGGGMAFNNTATATNSFFYLTDYGYLGQFVNFNYRYQTLNNYQLGYQIGTGAYETINATDITEYQYVRILTLGDTNWTAIGADASPAVGEQFVANSTTPTGSGTAQITPAAGDPMYIWGNVRNGIAWSRTLEVFGNNGTTNTAGYSIGATAITLTALNSSVKAGGVVAFANDDNRYVVAVDKLSGAGVLTIEAPGLIEPIVGSTAVLIGANPAYQLQESNPAITFGDRDIIQSNRDFYSDAGFDTNTGVTVGTAAEMALATPTNNHGFWVTDEGTWNQSFTGTIAATAIEEWDYCEIVSVGTTDFTDIGAESNTVGVAFVATGVGTGSGTVKPAQGRLYVGDGADWNLTYTPYQYPFFAAAAPPFVLSATINVDGDELAVLFSESCTTGVGGNGGITLAATGGAVTATYSSGSGSGTYVYTTSRPIQYDEDVSVSYVQPGDGIQATTGGADVASFTDQFVDNQSIIGEAVEITTLNVTNLVIGN